MQKIILLAGVMLLVTLLFFRSSARAGDQSSAVWDMIGKGALLIDVRTEKEFKSGHLDGALNIAYEEIDALAKAIGDDKSRQVVLYCRSGRRSGMARESLVRLGYTNVVNGGSFNRLQSSKP